MPHPIIPTFSRGGAASAWNLYRPGPSGGGRVPYGRPPRRLIPQPYDEPPQPLAADSGQVALPDTPFDLGMSREGNYLQDLRERRTSSSPNFVMSVERNNAMKSADATRAAAFIDAKRAGVAAIQQQNGGIVPGDSAAPSTPPTALGEHGSIVPMSSGTPGLVNYSDGSSKTTLQWGTPGTPATAPETAQHWGDSERQRLNAVLSQQNRGLGLPVQDGGAFKPRPIVPGTPAVPGHYETTSRTFAAPQGAYGLTADQLAQVNRDADQQAYSASQLDNAASRRADDYAVQGIVPRAKQPVAARATATHAPPATIIKRLPFDQQEQAASDIVNQWRSTTQPSQPVQQGAQPTAPAANQNTPTASSANFKDSVARENTGKPLNAAAAKYFLERAGGDKAKAREFAKSNGYAF